MPGRRLLAQGNVRQSAHGNFATSLQVQTDAYSIGSNPWNLHVQSCWLQTKFCFKSQDLNWQQGTAVIQVSANAAAIPVYKCAWLQCINQIERTSS